MKGKRKLSGVLLIIAALVIMQLPVSEADAATSASDFTMEGTTLVKYRGTEKNVSVPNTVEVIAEGAFEENDTIERVVLPDSVKRIEAFSFWGCDNLNTVVLGKGLIEVGDYCFTNCKGLEEMTIPENIRSIGIQAFSDCVNMTDITIPPEVTVIHETAFDGCYKLYIHCEPGSVADGFAAEFYEKQKEMPEYEDVDDYQSADDTDTETDTNSGNQVSSNDVVHIEGDLLGSTHIVGNQAVVFIDNTSLTVLGGENEEINSSEGNETADDDGSPEDSISNAVQDEEKEVLPKYTIVDGRVVADQAYYKNKTLKAATLPEGIEEIGQFAFARSSVTKIVIPDGVKEICYGAFYHADSLKEAVLPATIENVEPKAFTNSLWVENFLQYGTTDFLISGNVLVAYRGIGEDVVIPEGVTVIAGEAFLNQTQMKSVQFPESLITIGEGAFEGCTSLSKVAFGSRVARIKDRAFAGCPLAELILPASVSEMGLKVYDESVNANVLYEGSGPAVTHETSAERLSNEKYRPLSEQEGEIGVQVTGVKPAYASLEGANRSYTLSVEEAEEEQRVLDAYYRVFQKQLPLDAVIYDIQLTDSSEIPITKLGKQALTVILPVPDDYADENILIYSLDRNGQLEIIESERVLLDGVDAVRFKTTYLSSFCICGDSTGYNPENVLELSTTLQNMSAPPAGKESSMSAMGNLSYIKWAFAIALLMWGTVNVLRKSRH